MNAPFGVVELLNVAYIITGAYLLLLGIYALGMLVVAMRESRYRQRQEEVEDYDTVLASRYAIPVTIIAPAFNEAEMVVPAVQSLLSQSYREFEVIAVDDGSTDETLAVLKQAYDLEPRQMFFKNVLETKPVLMVYRSRKDPRLTVVAKENGGKADALNCGLNFARYRYLACVDGDTVFAPDAILRGMALIAKDPGTIVGAASLFGVSVEPEKTMTKWGAPTTNGHLLGDFQHLDMMRAFVAYRQAWSQLDCMMCVSGGFGLWRRDVILEVGGFSPEFSCEDIEMTFRVHERYLREKRPYRIISLPSMVANTEGPKRISGLVSQRARWQRVILETIWEYARMIFNPRYKAVGLLGLPYYLLFEGLAPLFQLLSLVALIVAIVVGLLGWPVYLALFGLMMFATAIPTTVAVLLHDAAYRDYRVRDLIRMMALGPLDLLLYRPILMWAGLRGTWQFLRKEKRWNKFERNRREAQPVAAYAS